MSKSSHNPNYPINLSELTTYQSGVVQSHAHRALKKFTDSALKPHGLTTMQWFIIGTVLDYDDDGIRVTDLSNKLGTTLSFLTNSINLLVSKEILLRVDSESDNRSRQVIVNPDFRNKCSKIEEDLRNKMRKSVYATISQDELRTYITVLYKLAQIK